MSTEIKSVYFARYGKALEITASTDGAPFLTVSENGDRIAGAYINVPRADFLAAVAAECNVIVIDRADLPEVTSDRHGLHVDGLSVDSTTTKDDALRDARGHLALAEHLDAHPRLDEAQVEALADAIRSVLGVTPDTIARGDLRPGTSDDLARRLIAAGWSK